MERRLCGPGDGKGCICCLPQQSTNCTDVGCSRQGDGFECKTEEEAAVWPLRCRKSPKLCQTNVAPYTVTMTADNEFKLFADGVEIGTGASWSSSFTFTTTATQVLAVEAVDRGLYEGILLSTSNGIVSDTTWKCSKRYIKGWNQPTFNDGLWSPAVLATGPWGGIPPISSTAQWIWASPSLGTSGPAPERVYCRKKLGEWEYPRIE